MGLLVLLYHQFNVRKVKERLVLQLVVAVPINALPDGDSHSSSHPLDKPLKVDKPFPVVPIQRVGSHIHSEGWGVNVLAVEGLADPLLHVENLLLNRALTLKDEAVIVENYSAEESLKVGMTGTQALE